MVEKFDVGVKRAFNLAHAFLALIFWVVLGIVVGNVILDDILVVCIIAGICIGVLRLFIIRDKYSWEITILESIEELKDEFDSQQSSKNDITNMEEELKKIICSLENMSKSNIKLKNIELTDESTNDYLIKNKDGRLFAVSKDNPNEFLCPKCHKHIYSELESSCSYCGESFMVH